MNGGALFFGVLIGAPLGLGMAFLLFGNLLNRSNNHGDSVGENSRYTGGIIFSSEEDKKLHKTDEQDAYITMHTKYLPQDPVIGFASRQDYRAFFESEFRRRRNGLYPPFTILARILAESRNEESAAEAADMLETRARELLEEHPEWQRKVLTMLKDTPSVKFLKGKFRKHILIKALVSRETDSFFSALPDLASGGAEDAEVWFEVNPNSMM